MSLTYAEAGVDLHAADENVRRIAAQVRSTHGPQVLGQFGAFAGLYHLSGLRDPVLVASTDGVGSKLQLGIELGRHAEIGRDLVHLSVNDVLTTGARPLFFLDYVAVHVLEPATMEMLLGGMAAACRENGCALLGGETAQLPDLYRPSHYDLAGFVVGVVERSHLVDGARVQAGDRVWALPSTGLHTNGYSLARKVVAWAGLDLDCDPGGLGQSLADALMAPHPSYLSSVGPLLERGWVRALAHITGGGLGGNLPRVLPEGLGAALRWGAWPVPAVFGLLARVGGVPFAEMARVFNLGIGMALVLPADVDPRPLSPAALEVGQVVAWDGSTERVHLVGRPASLDGAPAG